MTDGKLTPWALRDIIVTELRTYSESVNPTEPAALLEWEIEMLADRILDRARGASIKPFAIGVGQQAARTEARFVELSEKIDGAAHKLDDANGQINGIIADAAGSERSLKSDHQLTRRVILAAAVAALIAFAALLLVAQMQLADQIKAIGMR